jgi:hypothetical protein
LRATGLGPEKTRRQKGKLRKKTTPHKYYIEVVLAFLISLPQHQVIKIIIGQVMLI